jgi:hypothetical protein
MHKNGEQWSKGGAACGGAPSVAIAVAECEEQKDMNSVRMREREKPPGHCVNLAHASASTAQHIVAHASTNC